MTRMQIEAQMTDRADEHDIGKPRRVKRFAGFVLGSVALVGVAASFSANAGLCLRNGTHLQDIDFFKSAIDIVIHDPVDGVVEDLPDSTVAKLVHSQKYSSPDEFLSEFPHCCRFVPPNSGDGDGLELGILD